MIKNMLKDINDYLIDNNVLLIFPKSEKEKITFRNLIAYSQLPITFTDLSTENENVLLLRYFPHIDKYDNYLRNNLNIIKKNKKNYKEALEAGLNLLKIGNPNVSAYRNLAIIYLKSKDLENAIKYFKIVYYFDKYNNEDSKNTEKIIKHLQKVIKICDNPELIELYDSLISSINDYITDYDDTIHINIKGNEYDLFKRIIKEYKYLYYSNVRNNEDFNVTIKSNQRRRIQNKGGINYDRKYVKRYK